MLCQPTEDEELDFGDGDVMCRIACEPEAMLCNLLLVLLVNAHVETRREAQQPLFHVFPQHFQLPVLASVALAELGNQSLHICNAVLHVASPFLCLLSAYLASFGNGGFGCFGVFLRPCHERCSRRSLVFPPRIVFRRALGNGCSNLLSLLTIWSSMVYFTTIGQDPASLQWQ